MEWLNNSLTVGEIIAMTFLVGVIILTAQAAAYLYREFFGPAEPVTQVPIIQLPARTFPSPEGYEAFGETVRLPGVLFEQHAGAMVAVAMAEKKITEYLIGTAQFRECGK